ncbi:MAG: acyl-CoA thioesterase [bacterium]|nr:acyl-CoA thioesterase [bacterium]
MTFRTRLRYRFGDIDEAGIAYYPKLLHYFHCAFEDWWSDGLGYPYPKFLQGDKLGLPAVRLEADFFAPIRYGDEPWVWVAILRLGRSSVDFGFWMTVGDDAQPRCRAKITTALVDMDKLVGTPLPADWRERFAPHVIDADAFPDARA